MAPAAAPIRQPSTRWAALLGLAVLVVCGGGWWFFARPKPVEASQVLERYAGRWVPDWPRMQGETGTLGAGSRAGSAPADAARVVDSWKRRGVELVVDRNGEVLVVAAAEPGSPVVSKHAASVEGEQLRLRGLESNGKVLPSEYVSVLRLRRDGVLLWIPLFGGSGELTVLLRRP